MGPTKSILIIDDEPMTTTYFATLLTDYGFTAQAANNADEGLRKVEADRPDLILLDLLMPGKSGINLFNKIKRDARFQGIPIIIVSGIRAHFHEDHKEFFHRLKRHKAAAYLEKPVNPDELVEAARKALQLSR